MSLRPLILPALLGLALIPAAAGAAAARTGCDSYGRCFEFGGPSDRLGQGAGDAAGDGAALWQRADADSTEAPAAAAAEPDPLALAHGTVGDQLQALADDD